MQLRAWADRPSVDVRLLNVHSPSHLFGLFVLCVGEPQGVLTHWEPPAGPHERGRTRPCLDGTCPYCVKGLSERWKWYVAARTRADHRTAPPGWKDGIFEMSAGLAENLRNVESLRGKILLAKRKGNRANSPVGGEVIDQWPENDQLPQPWDVRPSLLRMWGMNPERRFASKWSEAGAGEGVSIRFPNWREAPGGVG